MSKINAVRLINVNYNNNAISINDECFHLNGESTLMCLQNGGGKSVLVQMMTAPFVHKNYRKTKDRPFESYFTSNKPSFILVEWVLEQNAGYVLTGMMIRKSQEESSDKEDGLEIINFISQYKEPCVQDIYHLPVVEKGNKEMTLKGFHACRQLFESYKKDSKMEFFCYDMNNYAQSRQYFDKLMEYQIYYKEWENIIKKVNLKESGLSELFANCRDEKGLTEVWFLSTIEKKLNKEKDRMKEFQTILEKYVAQYKDNRSKIERRDTIGIFKEQAAAIEDLGRKYEQAAKELKLQENKIANFIQQLNTCQEVSEAELEQLFEKMRELEDEIAHLEYERLSAEFYQLEDAIRFHSSNRDMIEMERENLEKEAGKTEETLHLLLCAKQQEEVTEWEAEHAKAKQRLLVHREKEEDLEPERVELGGKLKTYYIKKAVFNKEAAKHKENEIKALAADMNGKKEELEQFEKAMMETTALEGELKGKISNYTQQEQSFNARYQQSLARNILGLYEAGTLEILVAEYEKELEQEVRTSREKRKGLEELRGRQKVLERSLEDKKEERIKKQEEWKSQQRQKEAYEEELEKRRVILRYINMEEAKVFDKEQILRELDRKLSEINHVRRNLEKDENELTKDLEKLVSGKMLELPKELEDKLTELGISIVYGMEWLKKNGYAEMENQKMVRANPFLPYALILSRQELKKLKEYGEMIPTSFPVPIVLREQLQEKEKQNDIFVTEFKGVSFYVWFNSDLLNEEKLKRIIKGMEEQLQKKRELIAIKQLEYDEYCERREQIKAQKVTEELYSQVKETILSLEETMANLETLLDHTRKELQDTKEELEKGEASLRKLEQTIEKHQNRKNDFEVLKEAYIQYEERLGKLDKCRQEKERILNRQKLAKELLEKWQQQLETGNRALADLEKVQEELERASRKYEEYEEVNEALSDFDVIPEVEGDKLAREWEAKYTAITSGLSQELQELERQVQTTGERYRKAEEELSYLGAKYKLKEDAWKPVRYNRKEEMQQESILSGYQRKIAGKTMLWTEENTQIAVLDRDKHKCLEQMKKVCQAENPIEKEKIQSQDYEACKRTLEYQKDELAKEVEKQKKCLQNYGENLTALAEYSEFAVKEVYEFEQSIDTMDSKELRNLKGILVRDYNAGILSVQNGKEQLVACLQKLLRLEVFQDEFYRKPLEAMLDVSKDAGKVLEQLDITIKAYDSLMDKILIDIAMIEKEKAKIVELLGDYVKEVHYNLGKIDTNSTIVVREKPIKMLKIQIPEWEENQNLYELRLHDFVDEITERSVQLYEKNENPQDYLGTRITTTNLYNEVVGLGNVQIRLYKIEAQREYPITWAEVAKNSGGEGFLSAFVILSSLLHYMRKDDTDIFAEKNEGKVLLMDNPFAQTNASHLLKPLMDMAKKTNTQLICLTGLGGESIYNRFDNIYVMNLVAARLKNGIQYLKSEHLRGDEPQTLELSQIEVVEQMELEF